MKKLYSTEHEERAVLAQVVLTQEDADEAADSLLELGRLADTAGIRVVGQLTQARGRPDGGTMFGRGKVTELSALLQTLNATTVIFDNPLNAIQVFRLKEALPGIKVLDRTDVILLIFARRARSAEAQTQVELVQTQLLLQRIPVLEEQQRFGGGGTGVRGPGESRLQVRNQPIKRRIQDLKRKLEEIERRETGRAQMKRRWPTVCLVGYTNAGKSTLLNLFARSDAYVDDRLFATLDTKTRLVNLDKRRQVLLTDTVGFIRNLPHSLVASFRSTLSVAVHADLLLLVVDAAYPRVADHIRVCRETLVEIGAGDVPCILVCNKCDTDPALLKQGGDSAPTNLQHLAEGYPQAIPVSAKTGYGIDLLKQAMIGELEKCCTLWQLPSAISATSRRAP